MERFTSKVLLFGEYSVLHNSMALTIPFEEFSGKFSYPTSESERDQAIKSNQGLRNFCNYILESYGDDDFKLNVHKFKAELDRGLFFESNIPQGFGLGSSGALVAAIFLRYLDKAGDFKDEIKVLSKEKIRGLKVTLGKMEGYFHGTSSGIDPLSILINEPLLIKSNFDVAPVQLPKAKANGKHVMFLLNTGIARDTESLVEKFKDSCKSKAYTDRLENELTLYTNDSINSFLASDTDALYFNLYSLINFQLKEMPFIFPDSYKKLVKDGIESRDYFLKVCGAGGGGYMLGFTDKWDKVKQQLKDHKLEELYRY